MKLDVRIVSTFRGAVMVKAEETLFSHAFALIPESVKQACLQESAMAPFVIVLEPLSVEPT
jgi:hypothetical protein